MKKLLAIVLTLSLLAACIVPTAAETTEEQVILKTDISTATVDVAAQGFVGMPATPNVIVSMNGYPLTGGEDYVATYSNNVNMGTATVRVIGIGNYYGSVFKEFPISDYQNSITLKGQYMGQADGELAEETYYSEHIITPGVFVGLVDGSAAVYNGECLAFFELYRLVGEELELVTTYQPEVSYGYNMRFTYDFSSVYEGAVEEGGEVFFLGYAWITSNNGVYSGTAMLAVPAKVPDGTEMVVEELPDINDFRMKYLSAYSPDGNLGNPTWTSSDTSVAAVENGAVTLLKPGKATITAQYGSLSASYEITVEQQNLANGMILSYDQASETAKIYYQGQLLQAGKDYTLTAIQSGTNMIVTVTGCGLFEGQLERTFTSETGEPVDHTHSFDYACDTTCNSCDYTRTIQHPFGTEWEKDMTNHWHECTVCGEKKEQAEHSISPEDPNLCTVCGKLGIPGDIDGNGQVNSDDVVQLLLHISMPDLFPIDVDADFTGDGSVTSDDVVQLLLHISMPDLFPLR